MSSTEWSSADRPPYTYDELRPLVSPRSIAVIGASQKPGSLGAQAAANLLRGSAADGVRLVNPRYDEIDGRPCFPTLGAIGSPMDCVVVAVPSGGVMHAIQQCADSGAKSAVIYASGFAEVGTDGALMQSRLTEIAQEADMRIAGPNCVGLVNLVDDVETQFLPGFQGEKVLGRVGVCTQSGALGYGLLQAQYRGVGVSRGFMTGNSCDVDVVDFMNYFVDDPATDVVAAVLEGLSSGDRLRYVAERAMAAGKPIIALKLGSGEVSGAAARSHTGAMIGSHRVFEAAFEELGIIQVRDYEALMETAQFLARAGEARADGIVVVSGSGGSAIMAADQAERAGLSLPQPSAETTSVVKPYLPDFASIANPADLTSAVSGDPAAYKACFKAFAADPQYGAVVFPLPAAGEWLSVKRAKVMSEIAADIDIPLIFLWLSEWLQGPGSDLLDGDPNVAIFRSSRRGAEALHGWLAWSRRRRELTGSTQAPSQGDTVEVGAAAELLAGTTPDGTLDEHEAKSVLHALGVGVPTSEIARTATETAAAFERLGGPVVVKVLSPEITHKTRVGGVVLAVDSAVGAGAAYDQIRSALAGHGHPVDDLTVLVEKMAPDGGAELIVGARRDPHFGPVVVLGLGGCEVESINETALVLAPVDAQKARSLIDAMSGVPHVRESADALGRLLMRLSTLMLAVPDLQEIEINPLRIHRDQDPVALDGVIHRGVNR
jgi:acyl-CoA synthetase (NDP forming)